MPDAALPERRGRCSSSARPSRCCRASSSSRLVGPPPVIRSLMKRRVSAPVTGLKRIPSAMPAISSVESRLPERSFLPWRRSLALRRSSIASRSLSRIVVVRRDAARDRDRLAAVAGQLAVQLARGRRTRAARPCGASRRSSRARRTAAPLGLRRRLVFFCLRHGSRSFPLVLRLSAPGLAGIAALLALLGVILAGCGGASKPNDQSLQGNGFRFVAPAGWAVVRRGTRRGRRRRPVDRVEVLRFSS